MRSALALLALLALPACSGPGSIFLTVEGAGLTIPDDVDEVRVVARRAGEDAPLLDKRYPLSAGTHAFPLTLALETRRETGATVALAVDALKEGRAVGDAHAVVEVVEDTVARVTLRVVRSP